MSAPNVEGTRNQDHVTGGNTFGSVVGNSVTESVGFFGSNGAVKQTVSGSKGANAALTSLIAALVAMGLIIDTTT